MLQARRITRDHYREILKRRKSTLETNEFHTRFFNGDQSPSMLIAEQDADTIELFEKYYPDVKQSEIAAVVGRTWRDDLDSGSAWFLVVMDRDDLRSLTIAKLQVMLNKAMSYTPRNVRSAMAGKAA